jgi:hypothetical protein
MQKKELTWIGVLLVLGAIYIHFFGHWFDKKQIIISASIRPSRKADAEVYPVYFTLNDDYKLNTLTVFPLQEGTTNAEATPVWHLISDSNSVPTRAFRYGQHIGGMKPALKGVHAEALAPDVVYRIVLTSGGVTGSTEFGTKAATP